jgi:hypothetical protein
MPGTIHAMDATTARTLNIRQLVAAKGGPAAFSREVGAGKWPASQVSQWVSQKKPKGIGHNLAREIEGELGLRTGTLDNWTGEAPAASQSVGLDATKLAASIKFLDDLFRAKGRAFIPADHALLIAQVYSELLTAPEANLIELGLRYGKRLDGDANERQGKVGSTGTDDLGSNRQGPRKAKAAAGRA